MSSGIVPIALDIMYRMKLLIEIDALRLRPAPTNLSQIQQKKFDLKIPIKAPCTEPSRSEPELPNTLESIDVPNTMGNPHPIIISISIPPPPLSPLPPYPSPPSTPSPFPHL